MKFAFLSRGDQVSNQIMNKMESHLKRHGLTPDLNQPDLVLSVGGDGTLLEAFHRYKQQLAQTAFIGVHTGRLGFYADWRPHEIDRLLKNIVEKSFETVSYPLLELVVQHADGTEENHLALNECTVKTLEGSMVMNILINDQHFETFRGDGLCLSTPSGSTAYNKSLGGAIVHPSLSAIQLTEMASINNRVYRTIGSPLIFPDHHTCTLTPVHEREHLISIDHLSFTGKDVQQMVLRVAKEKIRFARYERFPFWKRVKESFVSDT